MIERIIIAMMYRRPLARHHWAAFLATRIRRTRGGSARAPFVTGRFNPLCETVAMRRRAAMKTREESYSVVYI